MHWFAKLPREDQVRLLALRRLEDREAKRAQEEAERQAASRKKGGR